MRALRFLLRKEFLQILRDRIILRMLFLMPFVQLVVLANAATFEVKSARLAVVDQDRTEASRGIANRLLASGRFVFAGAAPTVAEADRAMLDRDVDIILVVPRDFGRDVGRDRRATIQLIVNAEDGGAAGVMMSYASEIVARYANELNARISPLQSTRAVRGGPITGASRIEIRQRGWYNPELEYRDFMVPAILVVLITMIGTLLTAMNIVREKEGGTLDQLNVTPISRSTFIAAKLIPLWSIALVMLAMGLLVGYFLFGVPMRGNPAIIFLAAAIYLLGALGIGLWVSTIAETQQQAMFVTFAIMMVYLLMSGLFTPVAGMPEWAQWIAHASPIMHFAQLVRAVLLKGAGLADVASQLGMLSLIGILVLTLAVRRYRKRAE